MAKKTNTVQLVSDELQEKLSENLKKPKEPVEIVVDVEEKEEKPEIIIEKPQPVVEAPPVKMVKILMRENHRCCIGGEWYALTKGKQYNVPENVKDILNRADKLSPI